MAAGSCQPPGLWGSTLARGVATSKRPKMGDQNEEEKIFGFLDCLPSSASSSIPAADGVGEQHVLQVLAPSPAWHEYSEGQTSGSNGCGLASLCGFPSLDTAL